jgi:hypothetical protein
MAIQILPIDTLRTLPEAGRSDAGIYFLWIRDELQYIGMSTQVASRMDLQIQANRTDHVRTSHKVRPIPFDRHTCLVVESGTVRKPGLRDRLIEIEHAYILHYLPPMNIGLPG